jgi:hypothetical protein
VISTLPPEASWRARISFSLIEGLPEDLLHGRDCRKGPEAIKIITWTAHAGKPVGPGKATSSLRPPIGRARLGPKGSLPTCCSPISGSYSLPLPHRSSSGPARLVWLTREAQMALVSDRRSLTAKLLIVYVPMVCVSAVAVSLVLETQYYRTERAALVDGLDRLVALQHSALAAAAWEYDTDHVAALLADMEREPHLLSAVVLDESGRVVGRVGDVDSLPESPDLRLERELVFTTSGVSTTVGRLVAAFHTGEIWRDMRWHLLVTAAGRGDGIRLGARDADRSARGDRPADQPPPAVD